MRLLYDRNTKELLDLWGNSAGVGLWDVALWEGDPLHAKSRWTWTPEFRRLVGFSSPAEFPDVVQSWSDRLHPDDAARTFEVFGAALAGKTRGYDVTYRLKTRDGTYKWFRAMGGVKRDASGKAVRACGSLIDIQASKEFEMALELRANTLSKMASAFDSSASGVIEKVSTEANEMEAIASSMSASAEQTTGQAATVASATEQASNAVQTVASAAEELSASIREIGRQVTEASSIANTASEDAGKTNVTVRELADTASKIGDVVKLINDIASQTNLLALNATIEAARAGEAGKGFAVVAGEVKSLANQTAKATDEISGQIGTVQAQTQNVVEAIGLIVKRIEEISRISTAIASAVEEQSVATAEIAGNVSQAAQGTSLVASSIGGVSDAAIATGAASHQVLASAKSLSSEAEQLKGIVSKFLSDVRTA